MAKKKAAKATAAAVLTLRDVDQMSPEGRKDIAAWLRRQASHLLRHGDDYASRFRARCLYR